MLFAAMLSKISESLAAAPTSLPSRGVEDAFLSRMVKFVPARYARVGRLRLGRLVEAERWGLADGAASSLPMASPAPFGGATFRF